MIFYFFKADIYDTVKQVHIKNVGSPYTYDTVYLEDIGSLIGDVKMIRVCVYVCVCVCVMNT